MPKKIITVVEDKPDIRQGLKEEIEAALNGQVEVKVFATAEEFDAYRQQDEFKQGIRAQVFDLAANSTEEVAIQKQFSVQRYIQDSYNQTRVPIIIYSAFADSLTEFKESGTVFKIVKSGRSIDALCTLLQQMHETGFLELFSPNGVLESQHPADLHEVFTTQFKGNELPEILTLLKTCHEDPERCVDRVKDVFQRMSLRALVTKLNSEAVSNGPGSLKVNVLEHFYRRTNTSTVPIWTGDILEHTTTGERVYIMKPRCDLAWITPEDKQTLTVFACPVKQEDFANNSRKNPASKEVDRALKHNPALGISKRIIPPSTFYPLGGKYPNGSAVDFVNPLSPSYLELEQNYKYLVTLSDDFVNEIATRFGAYLVRPGITDINADEAAAWFEQ